MRDWTADSVWGLVAQGARTVTGDWSGYAGLHQYGFDQLYVAALRSISALFPSGRSMGRRCERSRAHPCHMIWWDGGG